jgi:hypothetical protein
MQTLLIILIVLAALATLGALIRGIIIFLRASHEEVLRPGASVSGVRQNKMMRMRIMFQAAAIILVVLLLLLAKG